MGGTAAAAHLPAGEVRPATQQGGPRPGQPDGSGARAGWGGGACGAAAARKGLGRRRTRSRAAARGVPPVEAQGGHETGRRDAQGAEAASGRAAALRRLAQGGPAA